jgi:hypothetical protein
MNMKTRLGKLETKRMIGTCPECGGKDGAIVTYKVGEPSPDRDTLACATCGHIPQTVLYLPEKLSIEQVGA